MENDIGTNTGEKVVSLDVRGADVLPAETVPVVYRCRVNGTPNGDSSSCQQATFTLYNVRNDDEGLYCCLLSPGSPHFEQMTDFVQLVVEGVYLFRELWIRALERDQTCKITVLHISRWDIIGRPGLWSSIPAKNQVDHNIQLESVTFDLTKINIQLCCSIL